MNDDTAESALDKDDPARYAPGTIGCHEALHMAHVFAVTVDRQLAEHPAVMANPEWKALADRAVETLNELYQAIGAEHVQGPARALTDVRSKALAVRKVTRQR